MVSFLIDTNELNQVLKRLKIIQKVNKGKKKAIMCEVTVKDGRIELNAPGLFQILEAKTNGTCKFSLRISFFTRVIASYKKKYLNFNVTEGILEIENYICNVNTTFFENDSILRSIQLPINFNDGDILSLTGPEFTKEELQFNQLGPDIIRAKKKLVMDLLAASQILADYKISYSELKTLVCNKLNIDPLVFLEEEIIKRQFYLDSK